MYHPSSILRLLFSVVSMTFLTGSMHAQDAYRLKLLDNWNDTALYHESKIPGQIWSELTGYVDSAGGKEYIIMGSIDSIYFFDVSDPTHIRKCDVEYGLNRAVNRDVEVLGHYVYCVSDNAPAGKLQIFDLSFLPDSVHKIYESDKLGINTHSLYISKGSKRLYMCINKVDTAPKVVHGMDILSIEKPDSPYLIGTLNDPTGCQHVHEAYVKNDTAFCSCEYLGLFVYDFTNPDTSRRLGSIVPPYPYNGYNHSSYTDSSNEFIAFTDEIPHGLPVKIFRIRELNDMTYETHFTSHEGSTPHNIFWKGNMLYISWYQDGVYLYRVDTPRYPKLYAYYDTYPQNKAGEYDNYRGCWGVYPFLPSGNIAASDMSNGLFMLKYDPSVGINPQEGTLKHFTAWPNPFNDVLQLHVIATIEGSSELVVHDLQGRIQFSMHLNLSEGETTIQTMALSELQAGIYFATLRNTKGELRLKLLKI